MTEPGNPDPTSEQPPPPLVPWEAPATAAPPVTASSAGGYGEGAAEFSIGGLLSDTFARYGADFLRLFLVSVVTTGISWASSFASAPARGGNPFGRPTGFVDVAGVLGLAAFVLGIVGGATMIALAEGGPFLPFGRALRRGVERAGWLFLTSLLLGLAFVAVAVLALIPIVLFGLISPVLAVVPLAALLLALIWAGLRLSLALPANVADNLNSIEALKVSWRVTRPTGVWARLLGAALLLGLLVLPAATGTMVLVVPAMFRAMAGEAAGSLPVAVFVLVPAIVFAIFTPLTALLTFSAYRRLVPPIPPSWTGRIEVVGSVPMPMPPGAEAAPARDAGLAAAPEAMPAPIELATAPTEPATAPTEPATAPTEPAVPMPEPPPARPVFRAPPFGTAAKALLALILAADVAGIAAIPYGAAELGRFIQAFDGFPRFPTDGGFPGGATSPGRVAFGHGVDLATCAIDDDVLFVSAGEPVEWLALLPDRVLPDDEVFLRVSHNGEELDTTLQDPGTYDCLGSGTPETGLEEGVYTFEVIVNGSVAATGAVFVQ